MSNSNVLARSLRFTIDVLIRCVTLAAVQALAIADGGSLPRRRRTPTRTCGTISLNVSIAPLATSTRTICTAPSVDPLRLTAWGLALVSPVVEAIPAIGTCLALGYGARLGLAGQITAGVLVILSFPIGASSTSPATAGPGGRAPCYTAPPSVALRATGLSPRT